MRHRFLRNPDGFTLIELLVVVTIVGLLAAMAMAASRHARIRAAEGAAVSALKAITQAQFTYSITCGNGRYAPSLAALGTPAPGNEGGFVSPDLAASDPLRKSGYVFTLAGTDAPQGELTCTEATPLESYRLTADPHLPGLTGTRYFGTNTDRVIYVSGTTFAEDMPESGPPGQGEEIR